MPIELLPALLAAIVLATVVVGVRRALRGGATPESHAMTDRRDVPPEGAAGIVDASIGMWLVRKLRAGLRKPDAGGADASGADAAGIVEPAPGEVAYRIGAVGAVRPTPPTRLVAVGSTAQPRPVVRPVPRPAAPEPKAGPIDPRLRLWRDTTVVALAIGFVVILGTQFQPFGTQGAVLAETFAPELPSGATLPPASGAVPSPASVESPGPSAEREPAEETARPTETQGTGGSTATSRPAATRTPSPTVRPTSPPTPVPSASASASPTPTDSPTESPTPPTPAPPTPTPTPEPTESPTSEP